MSKHGKVRMVGVGVSLSPDMLEELEKKAKELGTSVSDLVREALTKEMQLDNTDSPVTVSFSPELRKRLVEKAHKQKVTLRQAIRNMLEGAIAIEELLEERM